MIHILYLLKAHKYNSNFILKSLKSFIKTIESKPSKMVYFKGKLVVTGYPILVVNYQSSKFKNIIIEPDLIDYHPVLINYHVKMKLFINQSHCFQWQRFMKPFQTYETILRGF